MFNRVVFRSTLLFLLILITPFTLATTVLAGGGRMMLYTMSSSPYEVKEGRIMAQVYKEGSQDTGWSVGEKMEFRIANPQPGDYCKTDEERTKENGFIGAWCYADSAREMEVYLFSFDRNDRSSSYLLHFIDPPKPVATPKPSTKPLARVVPSAAPTAKVKNATPLPSASPDFNQINDFNDAEPASTSASSDALITTNDTDGKQTFWQFAFGEIKKYFSGWFGK